MSTPPLDTPALVESLTADYYRAADNLGRGGSARDIQHGVMLHASDVLARVTGKDPVVIAFRLDHGIPPGPEGDGWVSVSESGVVLLRRPDGTSLRVEDRLAQLHERHSIRAAHCSGPGGTVEAVTAHHGDGV